MNNELQIEIKGTTNFLGVELPNIYNGFGKDKKCILAKSVAEIHETRLDKINSLIKDNIDEFEIGIDILDLKDNEQFENLCKVNEIFSQNALNRSSNIYLLSESGYMALVMLMRTEKAKQIRKQLRKEYFAMREVINSDEQLKKDLLLKIYEGKESGIEASKKLMELEKHKVVEQLKDKVDLADRLIESKNSYMLSTFAKVLGIKGMGRNNLFKYLKENKIIFKDSKEPYQNFAEYFEVTFTPVRTKYGTEVISTTLKINARGIEYITKRLIKEGYIVTKSVEQIIKEIENEEHKKIA